MSHPGLVSVISVEAHIVCACVCEAKSSKLSSIFVADLGGSTTGRGRHWLSLSKAVFEEDENGLSLND